MKQKQPQTRSRRRREQLAKLKVKLAAQLDAVAATAGQIAALMEEE